MNYRQLNTLWHSVFYNVAWIGCILFAANNEVWSGVLLGIACIAAQLVWQFTIMRQTRGLIKLTLALTLWGTLIDTFYMRNGYIFFKANPFFPYLSPPWMIIIWISFSIFLFAVLHKLFQRYFLMSLLSGVGFALAYYVGARLDAAILPHGLKTIIIIGLTWAILLPLNLAIFTRIMEDV